MKQFYTYLHCKPDLTPFYVGKGFGRRSHDFVRGRNQHHKNTIAKYGAENIQVIVFKKDSEESAFKSEVRFIQMLRTSGFNICNQTNGGEGSSGRVFSTETRAKISAANKGKKRTTEERIKMSAVLKGNKYTLGHKLTTEHRKKISLAISGDKNPLFGKPRSEETKRKLSIANIGRKASDETKVKLSIMRKGKTPNKGKKASLETRQRMSDAQKARQLKARILGFNGGVTWVF